MLTAASCQHSRIPRLQIAEVVLGEWDLLHDPDCAPDDVRCETNTPTKAVKVQRFNITNDDVIVHESWDLEKVGEEGNDIAMIRLPREAITYNENIDQIVLPACLDWNQSFLNPPNTYIAAGWGRTNNDVYDRGDIGVSGAHSSKLRKVEVPYIPIDQCKSDYSIFRDLSRERQICAGGIKGK